MTVLQVQSLPALAHQRRQNIFFTFVVVVKERCFKMVSFCFEYFECRHLHSK
jgi:hypothetical protein